MGTKTTRDFAITDEWAGAQLRAHYVEYGERCLCQNCELAREQLAASIYAIQNPRKAQR